MSDAAEIRRAALEEAAEACCSIERQLAEANARDRAEKRYNQDRDERRASEGYGAQVCAEAIRALIAPPEPGMIVRCSPILNGEPRRPLSDSDEEMAALTRAMHAIQDQEGRRLTSGLGPTLPPTCLDCGVAVGSSLPTCSSPCHVGI